MPYQLADAQALLDVRWLFLAEVWTRLDSVESLNPRVNVCNGERPIIEIRQPAHLPPTNEPGLHSGTSRCLSLMPYLRMVGIPNASGNGQTKRNVHIRRRRQTR